LLDQSPVALSNGAVGVGTQYSCDHDVGDGRALPCRSASGDRNALNLSARQRQGAEIQFGRRNGPEAIESRSYMAGLHRASMLQVMGR